jgi:RNA polymerase sigma factor (sigma-70 family)
MDRPGEPPIEVSIAPIDPRPRSIPSGASAADLSDAQIAEFSDFYRGFVRQLVGFLVWQGAGLGDAADIAQQTMIEIYRRWPTIAKPQAYARTTASRQLARRIARVEERPSEEIAEHTALLRSAPDFVVWEQQQDLLRLLNSLPARQRQVMAWTLDGYTPTEIAEELNIDYEAVRGSLAKARRALAARIAREGTSD